MIWQGEKTMENNNDIDNVLDEFVSSEESTTEETNSKPIEAPVAPTTQSVEVQAPVKPEEPAMVVPQGIKIGGLAEENSTEVKLKDEDKTTDNNKIISNRSFLIKEVSIREDLIQQYIKDKTPMEAFNPKDKPNEIGYTTKLRILYEDSDYASYIPAIKWYYNEKTGTLDPWIFRGKLTPAQFDDRMVSTITKLYNRYCEFIGEEVGKVTTKDFIEGLKGKKVILEQYMSDFQGKTGFRLDIKKFVA